MNASVHVSISLISTCLRLDLDTRSLPSRKVCGSSSTARRLADNKSANSTNWPCVILLTSLAGIGAWPGPIMEALSNLVPKAEFARLGTLLMTLDGSVEKNVGATRRAELESVMADPGVKVGTNAGRVIVPEEGVDDVDEMLTSVEPTVDEDEFGEATLAAEPGTAEFEEGAFP